MPKTLRHVGARPVRYMTQHMTAAECDEAIRLYRADSTRDALAIRFDRHRRTIDNLIKRRNARRSDVDNEQ